MTKRPAEPAEPAEPAARQRDKRRWVVATSALKRGSTNHSHDTRKRPLLHELRHHLQRAQRIIEAIKVYGVNSLNEKQILEAYPDSQSQVWKDSWRFPPTAYEDLALGDSATVTMSAPNEIIAGLTLLGPHMYSTIGGYGIACSHRRKLSEVWAAADGHEPMHKLIEKYTFKARLKDLEHWNRTWEMGDQVDQAELEHLRTSRAPPAAPQATKRQWDSAPQQDARRVERRGLTGRRVGASAPG